MIALMMMPKSFIVSTLFTLIFLSSSIASAAPARTTTLNLPATAVREDDTSNSDQSTDVAAESSSEKKFYLFGGIDLGMSSYSSFNSSLTEGSRSGFHGGIRVLGAFYFRKMVLDAGLGWHLISNSGTNTDGTKNNVTTKGAYLEISPRFKLGKQWQLGPVVDYWFSTDNGLNPNPLIDTPSNTSLWGGVELLNEWMSDENKIRLGGRWLTGLNLTGRTVNVFQLFIQIGFDFFGDRTERGDDEDQPRKRSREELNDADVERASKMSDEVAPMPTPWADREGTSPEPIPEPTPMTEANENEVHKAQEKYVMSLDARSLNFDADSAKLPPKQAQKVREMGKFLGKNDKQWKSLVVSGHTDYRGIAKRNDALSKSRAQTVRQLLIEGGASQKKVKAVGMGSRKPIDQHKNAKAWAKNRRVDLEFHGVKDIAIINHGVSR